MRIQWQTIRQLVQYYPRLPPAVDGEPSLYNGDSLLNCHQRTGDASADWLVKVIIDRVTPFVVGGPMLNAIDYPRIVVPSLLFALILAVGDISRSLMRSLREVLAEKCEFHVRSLLLEKAANLISPF
ncbi:MAG: hypothetical protein R2932_54465 [Caldilineaceae bacterium]